MRLCSKSSFQIIKMITTNECSVQSSRVLRRMWPNQTKDIYSNAKALISLKSLNIWLTIVQTFNFHARVFHPSSWWPDMQLPERLLRACTAIACKDRCINWTAAYMHCTVLQSLSFSNDPRGKMRTNLSSKVPATVWFCLNIHHGKSHIFGKFLLTI